MVRQKRQGLAPLLLIGNYKSLSNQLACAALAYICTAVPTRLYRMATHVCLRFWFTRAGLYNLPRLTRATVLGKLLMTRPGLVLAFVACANPVMFVCWGCLWLPHLSDTLGRKALSLRQIARQDYAFTKSPHSNNFFMITG